MRKIKNNTIYDTMRVFENSAFMSAARAVENSSAVLAMRALENSAFMSSIRAFENSSIQTAKRALEYSSFDRAKRAHENSSASSVMKALENSTAMSSMRAFENSSVQAAKRAVEDSSVVSAMRALENPAISAIRALEDSSRFASFNELAEKLSSQIVGPLTLSEAYQVVTESFTRTSGLSDIDRLESLSGHVECRVKEAPKGSLSKEFYLALILSLILFLISQVSSKQSEERILLRIDKFNTTISQQLSELKANETVDTFYVVMRALNLRLRQNTKSEIVTTLYPNMKVKLIEHNSKWIRVEYFDYTKNIYISGWAHKKYLKIMNPKPKR